MRLGGVLLINTRYLYKLPRFFYVIIIDIMEVDEL